MILFSLTLLKEHVCNRMDGLHATCRIEDQSTSTPPAQLKDDDDDDDDDDDEVPYEYEQATIHHMT